MEFHIPQKVFVEKVQKTNSVIPATATRPILQNILIVAHAATEGGEGELGRIEFIGTDLDIGIKDVAIGRVVEPGAMTVYAKKLYETLQELPPAPIEFRTQENKWAELICGKAVFKIMSLAADRHPGLPDISAISLKPMNREIIEKMLRFTNYAVSTDEHRQILNGVMFKVTKDDVRMVATDGHRLAMAEASNQNVLETEFQVILTSKTVNEFLRLAAKKPSEVMFGVGNGMVVFNSGEEYIVSKLIEGEYPNYNLVIPQEFKYEILADRGKLYSLVHRVRLFADDKTRTVRLNFKPNVVEVTATSPETGIAYDQMDIQYDGEELLIGFNADYLLQALKAIDTETIRLFILKGDEPVIIKPFHTGEVPAIKPMSLVMPIVL